MQKQYFIKTAATITQFPPEITRFQPHSVMQNLYFVVQRQDSVVQNLYFVVRSPDFVKLRGLFVKRRGLFVKLKHDFVKREQPARQNDPEITCF